jgi:hypothetical protein
MYLQQINIRELQAVRASAEKSMAPVCLRPLIFKLVYVDTYCTASARSGVYLVHADRTQRSAGVHPRSNNALLEPCCWCVRAWLNLC